MGLNKYEDRLYKFSLKIYKSISQFYNILRRKLYINKKRWNGLNPYPQFKSA